MECLHAIVFDEARNRTVLYGGVGPDASGATRGYDDTWNGTAAPGQASVSSRTRDDHVDRQRRALR
jgi:hypothetical protein